MPKARLKPLLDEIHGTLYDVVIKKSSKGNTIITKRPDMTSVEWSKGGRRMKMTRVNDDKPPRSC